MNKKKKIILAVIIVVIIVAVGIMSLIYIINNLSANIYLRDNDIDEKENLIIFKNGGCLIWDTGASSSVIFNNFGNSRLKIGIGTVTDLNRKTKLYPICFARNISFDSVTLNNFIYNEIIMDNNVAQGIQDSDVIGILGMNVIENYNWLLDFTSNKIYNFDKNIPYTASPNFNLTYKERRTPSTNIKICSLYMKKLLIDSGFYGDIMLYDSDIELINRYIAPDTIINATSHSLYSDSIPVRRYVYYDVYINDLLFDKLTINEGKKRLIGIGFFRKFDRVFWDSKNREVRFYRD